MYFSQGRGHQSTCSLCTTGNFSPSPDCRIVKHVPLHIATGSDELQLLRNHKRMQSTQRFYLHQKSFLHLRRTRSTFSVAYLRTHWCVLLPPLSMHSNLV